jgi:hypothetical protein
VTVRSIHGEGNADLERSDNLVQQLSIAKYALTVGDTDQAMDAIDAALSTSRGSLSDLVRPGGPLHDATRSGALVRSTAAGSEPAVDRRQSNCAHYE